MRDVVRRLWLAYLDKHGLEPHDCPFEGLL